MVGLSKSFTAALLILLFSCSCNLTKNKKSSDSCDREKCDFDKVVTTKIFTTSTDELFCSDNDDYLLIRTFLTDDEAICGVEAPCHIVRPSEYKITNMYCKKDNSVVINRYVRIEDEE